MATLFNTKISETYEGLLKTIDNAAISATLKELTDGSGNQTGLFLNTAGDFKVTSLLEWGSLKDTGTGVTITQFVTAANGIENFNNDTTLPTSAAVKLYVDNNISTQDLDFSGNTGTGDVDLNSEIFIVEGKSGITTEASSNALIIDGSTLENSISTNTTNIGTNVTAIALNTSKVGITPAQASAITLNTAKVGITSTQAANIITNNDKVGITSAQANEIIANNNKVGITTGQSNAIIANTTNISTINTTAEFLVNKGQPSGYVPLDAGSKILETYLPASIIGGLKFQSTWNASTDVPTLPLANTVNGEYYIVSVAGTFESISYGVGDWIISNGVAWSKIDNTENVSTVFGRVGNILANSADYDAFYPTLANLPLLVSNNTAVAANTLKVGITTAQSNEITANTAKVGITSGQASEITANTSKTGITSGQTSAIIDNTAKVGYTEALVSANSSVAANTAKVGITTAQADEIVVNTLKDGITTAQVNAIADNTTNIATNTNEIATNTIAPQSSGQSITFIPIYTDTLEIGNSIMAQSEGTQNAKFINVYGRMSMNGGGGDANGGTLNLTSNSARLGIATNSITGNQPEAALDVGKNARVRGSLNVGLTNEQYLFVSTTGDTPVGYVKMGYYGTGTDYNNSGGAQAATQYTTAFSNGGKICEDERIMTFVLSRATMASLSGSGKELIPSDTNFTYIVKEAYIYSLPTSGGGAPTMAANENLVINYQTDNNGVRTTTAYKLGAAEFNAASTSRKLMNFEQSKAVVIGTVNAVPKSSVRISTTNGFATSGSGDCDFYIRMRVKNIDFNDDIKNNLQLITIS